MKSSKKQAIITIGIGLILLGVFFLVFAFSMPKQLVAVEEDTQAVNTVTDISAEDTALSEQNSGGIEVIYPLNLNTCTYSELMSIDGIGENRAKLILEYRDYLGGYTSVEQLKDIGGIGEETYNKISVYFTV